MIWAGGLSFVIHLLINFYFFSRKKILGLLHRPDPPAYTGLMRTNRISFLIVGIVFVSITASSGILTASILEHGNLNLVLIQAQVDNLRQPVAAADVAANPARIPDITPGSIIPPIVYSRTAAPDETATQQTQTDFETVAAGEGFWQPVARLVKKITGDPCLDPGNNRSLCPEMDRYYDRLTENILIKNGIIQENSELRIAKPGAKLTLDGSNNIYINGEPAKNYAGPKNK